jgi:hypothetical protein
MDTGPISTVRIIAEMRAQTGSVSKNEIPKGVEIKKTIKKLKYLDPVFR